MRMRCCVRPCGCSVPWRAPRLIPMMPVTITMASAMAPESDLMPVQLPTVVMPELLRSLERLLERSLERRRFTRRLTLPMWFARAGCGGFVIILVRCVSVLLIVGAVVVASLPFAMQAHSARRLAETSDSAARTVAGWPYPMAMEELERARAYNRRLAVEGQPVLGEAADPFTTRPAGTAGDADTADDSAPSGGAGLSAADTDANYQGLLDSGAGIMGTVLVPKIGVELPIRHGTSEPVLAVGAGHLYGTSLPVGGTGSHTVVTGHRGLVKSLMFTRLDELHDGDFMYIKVMDETLGYEVDRISVIEPDDVSRLKIVPGEDRLTLMTCTPYGINTHRLLVSGHRVAIPLPAPDPADVRDERATELGALAMTIVCTMGGMLLCCMVVRSMRPRHRIMRHVSAWPRKG